jgi:hypothetical protein
VARRPSSTSTRMAGHRSPKRSRSWSNTEGRLPS